MPDLETIVLARELGKLGGSGSAWVARLLPSVPHEKQLEVPADLETVRQRVAEIANVMGESIPELPSQPEQGSFAFLMGAGSMGLNPAIVHVRIEPVPPNTRVIVRAVAKEGLIRQRTARGAVERIAAMIQGNTG